MAGVLAKLGNAAGEKIGRNPFGQSRSFSQYFVVASLTGIKPATLTPPRLTRNYPAAERAQGWAEAPYMSILSWTTTKYRNGCGLAASS